MKGFVGFTCIISERQYFGAVMEKDLENFIAKSVATYGNMLFKIAFLRTKCRDDSEDIVQEVFILLLNQLNFDSEEHLKAWLIRTCINKCNNLLVSSKRKKHCSLDNEIPSLDKQDYQLIDGLLRLSNKDRDLLYLFYYEGYSVKELAQIFNKKVVFKKSTDCY